MMNTSYEDNFTFLRRQQQQAAENNRERLRASPAAQSVSSQNHHASATSLSSEESAFLVPRPKPSSPKEVSSSDTDGNAYLENDLMMRTINMKRRKMLIFDRIDFGDKPPIKNHQNPTIFIVDDRMDSGCNCVTMKTKMTHCKHL